MIVKNVDRSLLYLQETNIYISYHCIEKLEATTQNGLKTEQKKKQKFMNQNSRISRNMKKLIYISIHTNKE